MLALDEFDEHLLAKMLRIPIGYIIGSSTS
jgi:hypothetical protein